MLVIIKLLIIIITIIGYSFPPPATGHRDWRRNSSDGDPPKIRARFVPDPSKFFQDPFEIHGITAQEPGTLYHICAGGGGRRMRRGREGYNAREPQLYIDFTPHSLFCTERTCSHGLCLCSRKTARACKAGLAQLRPADIQQRQAPQTALAKLLLSICFTYAPQAAQWLLKPRAY